MKNHYYYFDNNATTRVDKRVLKVMLPYFSDNFTNPSSIYMPSQKCRAAIEKARNNVSYLLNTDPSEIVFTSGGTESNNTAIKGTAFALKNKGRHIITSRIEHPSVLFTCEYLKSMGYEITFLPVDKFGIIDPDELKKEIRKDTILITILFANNEIGTIEPIAKIAEIANERNIHFHTDAVQAAGKIDIDSRKLNFDSLSLSGHKLYGPKGTGILYIKTDKKFHPLLHGGGQEKYRRAGTENIAGIVGLGKACEIVKNEMESEKNMLMKLRTKLEMELKNLIPDIIINGHNENRLSNTLNFSIKGMNSNDILIALDQKNICASAGSACSSGTPEQSYVLKAIGLPEEYINGTIRLSLGRFNNMKEISYFLRVFPDIISRLRENILT